uniref:Uncharacterized protein n=1 Tax=Rhizophora mucronata TaxID=61149 RepID=A0A2P2QW26_RHIMU
MPKTVFISNYISEDIFLRICFDIKCTLSKMYLYYKKFEKGDNMP